MEVVSADPMQDAPGQREAPYAGVDASVTVEQHLTNECDKTLQELDSHAESLCAQLREEMERGVREIRASLDPARGDAPGAAGGSESAGAAGSAAAAGAGGAEAGVVLLTAEGGPHAGMVFELRLPRGCEAVMLGRSSGKKFKEKGVSLPEDAEVSTTHAKFENRGGRPTFTDVGSTNGTVIDGEAAVEGQAYVLRTGMQLVVGQTTLHVTLRPAPPPPPRA